jgi:hypothetical protein
MKIIKINECKIFVQNDDNVDDDVKKNHRPEDKKLKKKFQRIPQTQNTKFITVITEKRFFISAKRKGEKGEKYFF